jgi:hypothetical protein
MAEKQQLVQQFKPGSPELEALLGTGYNMTREEAEKIIAEREKNPTAWSLDDVKKARAFLAALNTSPIAVSKKPHWKVAQQKRLEKQGA